MDEARAVMRQLLDGNVVTFDGAFFTLRDVTIKPAPAQRVPILVGGRSDIALTLQLAPATAGSHSLAHRTASPKDSKSSPSKPSAPVDATMSSITASSFGADSVNPMTPALVSER